MRWINNCWAGSKVGKFIGTISFQTIQIEWRHSNVASMVHSFRSSSPWIEWLSCQNNFGLRANSTFPCLKYVEHWGGTGIPMLNLIVSLKVMSKGFVRLIARVLFMPGYFSPYLSLSLPHSPLRFHFALYTFGRWFHTNNHEILQCIYHANFTMWFTKKAVNALSNGSINNQNQSNKCVFQNVNTCEWLKVRR